MLSTESLSLCCLSSACHIRNHWIQQTFARGTTGIFHRLQGFKMNVCACDSWASLKCCLVTWPKWFYVWLKSVYLVFPTLQNKYQGIVTFFFVFLTLCTVNIFTCIYGNIPYQYHLGMRQMTIQFECEPFFLFFLFGFWFPCAFTIIYFWFLDQYPPWTISSLSLTQPVWFSSMHALFCFLPIFTQNPASLHLTVFCGASLTNPSCYKTHMWGIYLKVCLRISDRQVMAELKVSLTDSFNMFEAVD